MSLATWVRERRKLSASVVMMLTVTPPPGPRPLEGPGLGAAQHPLAALQDRRHLVRPQAGDATAMHPRRAGEGERRHEPLRRRAARHAAGVQHAGEGRPEAAEHAAERVGDRRQHEAPHRDLGEVGEDRGDEVAHAELAGLHELAHRVLGAAEAADQRIADALAGLLRLLGVVAHRLGRELPAGLRRLGRFRQLRRRGGAGAAGLADRVAELLGRDRRAAERGLGLLGRALHRVAQRLQRGERRGGGAGRGSGGGGEPIGPGAGLAGGGRGLVEGRARPDRRLAQGEHGALHAGHAVEAAGRGMQEVGPAALDAGERGQPAGLDRRPDRLQRQRQRPAAELDPLPDLRCDVAEQRQRLAEAAGAGDEPAELVDHLARPRRSAPRCRCGSARRAAPRARWRARAPRRRRRPARRPSARP